jgi:hypothetical protein
MDACSNETRARTDSGLTCSRYAHGVLSDAEVEISPSGIVRVEIPGAPHRVCCMSMSFQRLMAGVSP